MVINPFAEYIKILCAGTVSDIVECPDTDRVMDRDGHNAGVRVFMAFRWIPPQNQMVTCRADVTKPTNVDEDLVHLFTREIPCYHRYCRTSGISSS